MHALAPRSQRHPLHSPPRREFPSADCGCPPRRQRPECVPRSYNFPPQFPASIRRAGGGPRAIRHRQDYANARAALGPIVSIDAATMLLDDLLNDSKPKARALGLARHVRIENSTQQLALKSGAIVT